jgi:hypothetical protein
MILKKRSVPSAKWDHENNTWSIGQLVEFCWTDMQNKEISPWIKFSDALQWIIRYDQDHQEKNPKFENPEKIT